MNPPAVLSTKKSIDFQRFSMVKYRVPGTWPGEFTPGVILFYTSIKLVINLRGKGHTTNFKISERSFIDSDFGSRALPQVIHAIYGKDDR